MLAGLRDRGRLRRRVAALERELQEQRALQRRVAELTDVVAELLVPAVDRDDARVKAALERLDHGI
jgi:hypothetical protein